VGDIFSVRIAGNITSRKVLGSIEYACAVAGARLVLVMGHTRSGAVTAAVDAICSAGSAADATGCEYLDHVIGDIRQSIDPPLRRDVEHLSPPEKESLVDEVARRNVVRVIEALRRESRALDELVRDGRIGIAGAMYDVATADIEFLPESGYRHERTPDLD
jgi:carbonic anhydrase